MPPHVLAVTAVSPGMGKTTLCEGLVAALRGNGRSVEHFPEEDILSHPTFAAVADQFREQERVDPPRLLAAAAAYVSECDTDFIVADALLPFVHSLHVWGHDECAIAEFLGELDRRLRPATVSVLYLDGAIATGLARAQNREGGDWLAGFRAKLARFGHEDAETFLAEERDLTLRLLRGLPWPLHIVEHADRRTTEDLARRVLECISSPNW